MTEKIQAEYRQILGTGSARALRRVGKIPAVIYGDKKTNLNVAVGQNDMTRLYRKNYFRSTPLVLEVEGSEINVIPHHVELNPITDLVSHVEFLYLKNDTQKISVPVVFEGKERSLGVKRGGFFNIIKRRIEIECRTDSIPQFLSIDVTNMRVGKSIKASELKLPEGASLVKKDQIIASIIGKADKTDKEEA